MDQPVWIPIALLPKESLERRINYQPGEATVLQLRHPDKHLCYCGCRYINIFPPRHRHRGFCALLAAQILLLRLLLPLANQFAGSRNVLARSSPPQKGYHRRGRGALSAYESELAHWHFCYCQSNCISCSICTYVSLLALENVMQIAFNRFVCSAKEARAAAAAGGVKRVVEQRRLHCNLISGARRQSRALSTSCNRFGISNRALINRRVFFPPDFGEEETLRPRRGEIRATRLKPFAAHYRSQLLECWLAKRNQLITLNFGLWRDDRCDFNIIIKLN